MSTNPSSPRCRKPSASTTTRWCLIERRTAIVAGHRSPPYSVGDGACFMELPAGWIGGRVEFLAALEHPTSVGPGISAS